MLKGRERKGISFKLKFECYGGFECYVSVGQPWHIFRDNARKLLTESDRSIISDDFDVKASDAKTIFCNGHSMIYFSQAKPSPGLIAHEAFHAIETLFEHIGIEHNMDNSGEAWAYLLEYIVNYINCEIIKYGKKRTVKGKK
jgi:hypothetical protein